VDQARGEFLAGARIAADHHRGLAAGQLDDGLTHALDRLRAPDHTVQDGGLWIAVGSAGRLRSCVFLGIFRVCGQLCGRGRRVLFGIVGPELQCRSHQVAQRFEVDRLGDEIECTVLQGGHRVFDLAVGSDHCNRHARIVARDLLDQAEPIAIGKAHVGQAEVELSRGQLASGVGQVLGGLDIDAHARQRHVEQLAQIRLIVDHQRFGLGHG